MVAVMVPETMPSMMLAMMLATMVRYCASDEMTLVIKEKE